MTILRPMQTMFLLAALPGPWASLKNSTAEFPEGRRVIRISQERIRQSVEGLADRESRRARRRESERP